LTFDQVLLGDSVGCCHLFSLDQQRLLISRPLCKGQSIVALALVGSCPAAEAQPGQEEEPERQRGSSATASPGAPVASGSTHVQQETPVGAFSAGQHPQPSSSSSSAGPAAGPGAGSERSSAAAAPPGPKGLLFAITTTSQVVLARMHTGLALSDLPSSHQEAVVAMTACGSGAHPQVRPLSSCSAPAPLPLRAPARTTA
jgi:hypothetical protein